MRKGFEFPKNAIYYKNYMIVNDITCFWFVYKKDKYDITCLLSGWHWSLQEAKKSIDFLIKENIL